MSSRRRTHTTLALRSLRDQSEVAYRSAVDYRCGVEVAPCAAASATYQPTYKPTYKPSLRGSDGCADDADWLYDAGDKGLKGCDHIASEPAKVEKRCSRRVGEDGVPALEACKQTCGKC